LIPSVRARIATPTRGVRQFQRFLNFDQIRHGAETIMKTGGFGQPGDEKFPATLPATRFLISRTMKDEVSE